MPRVLRRLLLPTALAAAVYLASLSSRFAAGLTAGIAIALVAIIYLILPRLAHRSFERGQHRRAEILYRILRVFITDPVSRGAIDVSVAGCRLARADFPGALADLARVTPDILGVSARAAWHNNRAYALARDDRAAPPDALREIDEAIRLRPDVAGFRHTRGVVLIALGRLDDAIAELDEVWRRVAGDDAPPLLEAERCYDLGVAWSRKGEPDYAADYFERAQAIAPLSPWAPKARILMPDRAKTRGSDFG